MITFTHLHVHTEYSLLDGAARIKELVAQTKKLGMNSLAITDHGAMFGVIDFYRACKKEGIKPIIGCEVYTASRSRLQKEGDKDKNQGHLVLLAETQEGLRNLMKIVSIGYLEGFYYKPRIDKETLANNSQGIIALSACLAGDVQRYLLMNDYERAKGEALAYQEIFGKDNFFLELQDQGLEDEAKILLGMIKIHEETGIPFVATNDVHYVNKEDAEVHDVLLCIQTAATVDEEDRMRFANDQFYLKSPEEMGRIFSDIPQAIENTMRIADRCQTEFTFGELHLPDFQAPEGRDNFDYLKDLCQRGLKDRYGDEFAINQERLDYELSVISSMQYVEYFLIVWDFIHYAKSRNIMVGPGRGSAAGSLVAYTLGITDIDPIKYGLIFERFLNPERISMPDIDIDFCYERRQEVIDYVIEKYGSDKVAQIITFGTMKAKMAIRSVGKALNMSYGEVDAIAKAVPNELGITIDSALKISQELREKYEGDLRVKKVIDTAKAVEGMPRHASTHAAGVVISKKNLNEYVPLYLADKGISTQFTMNTIEELGLLKMDFLGLRNLTVIQDALAMIKENHGLEIDFSKMDYNDPKVYEIISSGNTEGLFQLESPGMTQFMKNQKPDGFEDIVAGISLYRPGPMASIPTYIANKKCPQGIEYLHESLRPILEVTYGCLVYQEQVMEIVRDLAGYSYGRSDLVRRAMSKKKMDVMLKEQEAFIHGNDEVPGCKSRGIPEDVAAEIFNQMVSFAEYAFNKSHAAAYAVIAYETGYLKANFPVEFMAALMTSVMGDAPYIARYIRNCNDMGISVLPPDINKSGKKFTVDNGKIRFGLMGVKNVGEGIVDAIIKARKEKGLPLDIVTFIQQIDSGELNKKALESLIKAGAFDEMHDNRAQLIAMSEGLLTSAQNDARKNIAGQVSLFGASTDDGCLVPTLCIPFPDVRDFDKKMLMTLEKENLGVYLSDHPLNALREQIERKISLTSDQLVRAGQEEIDDVSDGMEALVAGIIVAKKTLVTKNGQMMAFIDIEDFFGIIEVVVFPKTYESCQQFLEEDRIIMVKGTVNFKEEETPKILANRISLIEEQATIEEEDQERIANAPSQDREKAKNNGGNLSEEEILKVKIPRASDRELEIRVIKDILRFYPGDCPVLIYVEATGNKFKATREFWVRPCDELIDKLASQVGTENIKICGGNK
jgi:DNA polymerase-3 subunit alpha